MATEPQLDNTLESVNSDDYKLECYLEVLKDAVRVHNNTYGTAYDPADYVGKWLRAKHGM